MDKNGWMLPSHYLTQVITAVIHEWIQTLVSFSLQEMNCHSCRSHESSYFLNLVCSVGGSAKWGWVSRSSKSVACQISVRKHGLWFGVEDKIKNLYRKWAINWASLLVHVDTFKKMSLKKRKFQLFHCFIIKSNVIESRGSLSSMSETTSLLIFAETGLSVCVKSFCYCNSSSRNVRERLNGDRW